MIAAIESDAISVHPSATDELGGIEDHERVDGADKLEVRRIGKQIGLHHSHAPRGHSRLMSRADFPVCPGASGG